MTQLSQHEADSLLRMDKHRKDDQQYLISGLGDHLSIPLISNDGHVEFTLDIRKSRIDLRKGTLQNRTQQVHILVRLDFGGAPHRNPDDKEVPCPHLHVYKEGFGDKWAIEIPQDHFKDLSDFAQTLEDFMSYCNIVIPPTFQIGAF